MQLKLIIINYSIFKEQNHSFSFSECKPVSVYRQTLVAFELINTPSYYIYTFKIEYKHAYVIYFLFSSYLR